MVVTALPVVVTAFRWWSLLGRWSADASMPVFDYNDWFIVRSFVECLREQNSDEDSSQSYCMVVTVDKVFGEIVTIAALILPLGSYFHESTLSYVPTKQNVLSRNSHAVFSL